MSDESIPTDRYDLFAVDLSPYALKVDAMLDFARIKHRWLPLEGGRLENARALVRVERAKRAGTVMRHGGASELDEYPSVPFLIGPDGSVHYDSTALADWLDDTHPPDGGRLVPEEPVSGFIARFIDEAFDEFGLYMVHHNRWVLAAADNGAGGRLAKAMGRLCPPPIPSTLRRSFPRRQVRRLPYLFSVAEPGFDLGLVKGITPPSRPGFPPTHALLDGAWHRTLAAMERLLERQRYLLGDRFTVADASAYGQLSMNLTDHSAADALAERAPRTDAWLRGIRDGGHVEHRGDLAVSDALRPLLAVVAETFVPLMRQNERAHTEWVAGGETLFNEAAFDRGRSLYDGEIEGVPFRSVVKTFQVRTWQDLRARWLGISGVDRTRVEQWLPSLGDAFEPLPIREGVG